MVAVTRLGPSGTPRTNFDSGVGSSTTAFLTGTIIPNTQENVIVTGGLTIIINIVNDTWIAAGTGPIGTTANTQALIDGITSSGGEAAGWNIEVRDNLVPATDVVRTSNSVATITLPASASYDITGTETITVTIPAVVLVTSATEVVASTTFEVRAELAGGAGAGLISQPIPDNIPEDIPVSF